MSHAIENSTLHPHFGPLLRQQASRQALAEDGLEAKDRRLSQGAPMIADLPPPLLAPDLPNAPQIDIARMRRCLAVPVLPDVGIASRWNGDAFHGALLAGRI